MITGEDIPTSVMVMASGGGGGLVQSPPDMMHHHNIMDTSSHVEIMPSEYYLVISVMFANLVVCSKVLL